MNSSSLQSVPMAAGALLLLAALLLVAAAPESPTPAERGEYLVNGFGCGDCHTPWKMGETGPQPDIALFLSGHPEALEMPPAPKLPEGPWLGTYSGTFTGWAGPWGVSFSANITSDKQTGIGAWTEETFLSSLRTGRHMGRGRPILPPMPYPAYKNLSDDDLKAIFAYLLTVPAIDNKVPEPVAPASAGGADAR